MKSLRLLTAAAGIVTLLSPARAADESQPAPEKVEKKELRVLAAPDGGRPNTRRLTPRVIISRGGEAAEKETVTYLGVITSPVSPTLSAQLGLANGAGLVVNHLEENSPAASTLKEHDVLVKLDDQLLVDQHQLSVLIRQKKEGDEVTLTYVRAGKQATAKIKLGKHEVPKFSEMAAPFAPGGNAFAFESGPEEKFKVEIPGPRGESREEVDHILSLIDGANGHAMRMRIDREGGPGFRAMSVNTSNSNLVYSDDKGLLELTVKDGKKSLVAKNKQGDQVFAGPVNSPEERKAMPADVRQRLEDLEGMQDMTFHTDGDFQGAETRTLRPAPKGISWPQRVPAPMRAPAPTYF